MPDTLPDKRDLLIVNEFHPETVSRLDELYQTHKLWLVPEAEQTAFIQSLEGRCQAAATASWDCNPLCYELDSLQLISAFGVGVDGIDFSRTAARSIRVTNTPNVLNDAVADLSVALVLATSRNLINADHHVRSGQWAEGPFPFGTGLAGKTLGIIGLGRIGEAIAERMLPFKLNIAYHNRNPKELPYQYYDSLDSLARASDFLLCMLPGGEATRELINAEVFKALGPTAVFINVGRGSTVDEEALADALESGDIAAAGLDVYAQEPYPNARLLELPNVVLLPHIGSATVETRRAMGELVMANLEAWFANEDLITEVSGG